MHTTRMKKGNARCPDNIEIAPHISAHISLVTCKFQVFITKLELCIDYYTNNMQSKVRSSNHLSILK